MQDLATALCAFSSMRRLMKGDFLAEFLAEVAEKLPTFGTPALASVLGALGRLGYRPGDEWTAKVRWRGSYCTLRVCRAYIFQPAEARELVPEACIVVWLLLPAVGCCSL